MKILGIDYGRRKIGLAIGETETGTVEENKNFKIKDKKGIKKIKDLCDEKEIKKIVVGITGGKIDEEIRAFGANLRKIIEVPVEFFDETLTTQDAQRLLIESGKKRKDRKEKEDAIAAAIMLESYLGRLR